MNGAIIEQMSNRKTGTYRGGTGMYRSRRRDCGGHSRYISLKEEDVIAIGSASALMKPSALQYKAIFASAN